MLLNPVLQHGNGVSGEAIEIVRKQIDTEGLHIRKEVLRPLFEPIRGVNHILKGLVGIRGFLAANLSRCPDAGQWITDIVGDITNQFAKRGEAF